MRVVLIILIILFPTTAASSAWTTQDTILQATLMSLIIIDWGQTLSFIQDDRYKETNPILGEYPSRGEVNICIISSMVITTAIAYALPKRYRTIFQSIAIGCEIQAVRHNYQAGVKIEF